MTSEGSPEARLERMLAEGKITREQFEELKAALGAADTVAGRERPTGPGTSSAAWAETPPWDPRPVPPRSHSDYSPGGDRSPYASEGPPPADRLRPAETMPVAVPICVGFLVLAGLISLAIPSLGHISSRTTLRLYAGGALDLSFAWFLLERWRWAFYLCMASSGVAVVYSLIHLNILTVFLNGGFVVLLWSARHWYLKKR